MLYKLSKQEHLKKQSTSKKLIHIQEYSDLHKYLKLNKLTSLSEVSKPSRILVYCQSEHVTSLQMTGICIANITRQTCHVSLSRIYKYNPKSEICFIMQITTVALQKRQLPRSVLESGTIKKCKCNHNLFLTCLTAT